MTYSIKSPSGQFYYEDSAVEPCSWSDKDAAEAVADYFTKMKTMLSGVAFEGCTVVDSPETHKPCWRERWAKSPMDFGALVKLLTNKLS